MILGRFFEKIIIFLNPNSYRAENLIKLRRVSAADAEGGGVCAGYALPCRRACASFGRGICCKGQRTLLLCWSVPGNHGPESARAVSARRICGDPLAAASNRDPSRVSRRRSQPLFQQRGDPLGHCACCAARFAASVRLHRCMFQDGTSRRTEQGPQRGATKSCVCNFGAA